MDVIARCENFHSPNPNVMQGWGRTAGLCIAMCMALVLSAQSAAAEVTYQYTGNLFIQFSCGPSDPGPGTILCNTPAPANPNTSYLATDRVTATLKFDLPLPANLPLQNVGARAGFQLTMNDGHQTLTVADAAGLITELSTDAGGQINTWRFVINTGGALNGGIATINLPPSVSDSGTLACCDPEPPGDLGYRFNAAGIWSSSAICDIQLNQASYTNGQPVVASVFRFANASAAAEAVEIKVWLEVPGVAPIPFIRSGADGSVVFPAGLNANLGPFTLLTVSPPLPRGTYAFSCRLLNPVTGQLKSADLNTFAVN